MITNRFLMKLNHCYEQLDWIESLKDNWNDNGAKKFSRNTVSYVRAIVSSFIDIPFIAPTANESIQLEWENDNYYVELEISDNNINLNKLFLYDNKKEETIILKSFLNYTEEELTNYINNLLKIYGFGV